MSVPIQVPLNILVNDDWIAAEVILGGRWSALASLVLRRGTEKMLGCVDSVKGIIISAEMQDLVSEQALAEILAVIGTEQRRAEYAELHQEFEKKS